MNGPSKISHLEPIPFLTIAKGGVYESIHPLEVS